MAFSKVWDKVNPKKAEDLAHKPVDIKEELDKYTKNKGKEQNFSFREGANRDG